MARSQSKYQSILSKARERLEIARENVEVAENNLGIARAAFNAHQMAYNALEKELTPTPRKKPTTKHVVAQKDKPEDKAQAGNGAGPNCGICGNPADHSDHDSTYLNSHKFEAPGKSKKVSKAIVSAVGVSAGD